MFGLSSTEWVIGVLVLGIAVLWILARPESLVAKRKSPLTRKVRIEIDIDASVESVWNAIVDWESQSEWMVLTSVWIVPGASKVGVGTKIAAYTGLGSRRASAQRVPRWGFLDTMLVIGWQPPFQCDVLHTGKVVKGSGAFCVQERQVAGGGGGYSTFIWSEVVELPFGYLGACAWPFIRPGLVAGVYFSLKALARSLES